VSWTQQADGRADFREEVGGAPYLADFREGSKIKWARDVKEAPPPALGALESTDRGSIPHLSMKIRLLDPNFHGILPA
jgi:hypothetical protein